jgi:hypothetical protein
LAVSCQNLPVICLDFKALARYISFVAGIGITFGVRIVRFEAGEKSNQNRLANPFPAQLVTDNREVLAKGSAVPDPGQPQGQGNIDDGTESIGIHPDESGTLTMMLSARADWDKGVSAGNVKRVFVEIGHKKSLYRSDYQKTDD